MFQGFARVPLMAWMENWSRENDKWHVKPTHSWAIYRPGSILLYTCSKYGMCAAILK